MRGQHIVGVSFLVLMSATGCESCASCIGERIGEQIVAHSDAGPEVRGCPIPVDKQALVGVWRNERVSFLLAVASDCRVSYQRDGTKMNAPLMSFYGDDFSIGMMGIGPTFRVSAPPKLDVSGVMRMTVDGVELTKTSEAPGPVIEAQAIDHDN